MIQDITVKHYEHVSDRSYEDVIAAFHDVTGSVEEGFNVVAAPASTEEEFHEVFKAREGSSGFMRFLNVDHGDWLGNFGHSTKAAMIVLGNPLIAITMLKHDIRAGLNVPVRIYIYEGTDGRTRIAYDLPSTLMSSFDIADVQEAARKLDAKLIVLAETISGTKA